jgi:esterase/lipase superfamily enzyme
LSKDQAIAAFDSRIRNTPKRQVLLFVHGFNTKFEEAVYRFAQIAHDSDARITPVLFTWPSRGNLLQYGYDHESANFSRDALENVLQFLARDPNVGEISILAHSMGNWVTLEALRQMSIRNKGLPPKIKNIMLAAPDVDFDVFRRQILSMDAKPSLFTLFISRDDEALAVSRRVWGNKPRLGAVDKDAEPYRDQLDKERITVVDLTDVDSPVANSPNRRRSCVRSALALPRVSLLTTATPASARNLASSPPARYRLSARRRALRCPRRLRLSIRARVKILAITFNRLANRYNPSAIN